MGIELFRVLTGNCLFGVIMVTSITTPSYQQRSLRGQDVISPLSGFSAFHQTMPPHKSTNGSSKKIIESPRTTESGSSVRDSANPVKPVKFTKSKTIEAFTPPDNTIDICGWVDVRESPKTVGADGKYTVLKFVLNNNAGKRVHCVAWQNEVERSKDIIKSDEMILLRGAVASVIKKPQYNIGNTPVELVIREHTVIEDKGWYNENAGASKTPVVVNWEDVADMEGRYIEIEGWLKMMFGEASHKTGDAVYTVGAISDGDELKLAVRVMSSVDNLPKSLSLGSAVTVVGFLQYDGNCPYIKVARGADVKLSNKDAKDPDDLMDAAFMPKKRAKKE